MLTKLKKKRIHIFFFGLLIASDLFVLLCAFIFSYWFRFYSQLFAIPLGIPSYTEYFLPFLIIGLIFIAVANANGLYKPQPTRQFAEQSFSIFKSISITMLLTLAGTFFYRGYTYSRFLIFILYVSVCILLFVSRYFWDIFYKNKILPKIKKRIIVVGRPENLHIVNKYKNYFRYMHIVGLVSTRKLTQNNLAVENLGNIDCVIEILDKIKPDEVVLLDLELPRKRIIDLILESEKRLTSVKIVADLFDIMIQQFELENINGLNLIKIKESPLNYAYNRFLKRILDIAGSLVGLIILSPLFSILSILIKITSSGPVFFAQERIGEGGKTFKIYKFRTMRYDAEAHSGPVFALPDDERCTPIGNFLRRYNIDEFPQLFNVLKGEMSLVGPRPERPYFVEQFKDGIPRYMSRHHVKSGMTGWAQVNGLRQGTPIEERIKYDLYYLENWSLWFDLKIIFMSFFALKNAY